MKKIVFGFIIGFILATTTFAYAQENIKLIINGQEIKCDVPPQIINGRTMVPAKYVAEPLGAKVEWDTENNAVIIIGNNNNEIPTDLNAIDENKNIKNTIEPKGNINYTTPEIFKSTEHIINNNYLDARALIEILGNKYPNKNIYGFNSNDKLYIDDNIFELQYVTKNKMKYYNVEPLINNNILNNNDLKYF